MVIEIVSRNRLKIAFVSAISALAGAANIWLLALINRNAQLQDAQRGVAEFAVALGSMVLVSFLSQILLSRLSAATFYKLREQLVSGIANLSSQQIETVGSARLYTALTKDIPAVHELIIVLPNYVFNFTVVAACLVYLCLMSVQLFLIFLGFLLLALGVAKFAIADRAEKRFQLRRRIEDDLFRCYSALIDGNKELKLNRARETSFVHSDLKAHAEKYRDATLSAEFFWNMSNNWSSAMIFIAIGALLFLTPVLVPGGQTPVLNYIIVIFYLVGPLTILMNSFRTVYAARVGLQKLKDLDLDTRPRPLALAADAAEPFASLSLRGLAFEYGATEDGRDGFRVGPLDLDVRRGEIVYFVGGNGSGKTTAAKLVTGLYEKRAGSLLVNGREVVADQHYFQNFSAVFQDYYLFETLVPKLGALPKTEDVDALIARLRLSEKVSLRDGRLSTTKLSYGQRKRLALLVAYFDNSEIYVFDEWAADQDPEFREFFYKEFLFDLKRQGKTVIVVSHDDRYFHLADKVVKFEGGRIVSVVDNHSRELGQAQQREALRA